MQNAVYAVSYFYCYAECHYDESHCDKCLSAECNYAECCGSMKMGMNSIFYMSVKKPFSLEQEVQMEENQP